MESQPQNPEFRNNPENYHQCICCIYSNTLQAEFITEANTMNTYKTAPKGSGSIFVRNIGHKFI